jgi:hypothetical protein
MSRYDDTLWCDGCGVEITWVPIIKAGQAFCCQDCCDGIPCSCYRWSELDLDRRSEEVEGEQGNVKSIYTTVR